MKQGLDEIFVMLRRIADGGDVSFEEVQNLKWVVVDKELDAYVQRIYRELQMFASDRDIRSRDCDYDHSWRTAISKLHDSLNERTAE